MAVLALSSGYCASALLLDADFDPVNEKFYPLVLSVLMLLSSVGLLIWPSSHAASWPDWRSVRKIAITFMAILLFSFLLQDIGFIISASILMGVCMWVFEAPLKWLAPVSILTSVSFYIVFDRMLGLNLPAGLLSFL